MPPKKRKNWMVYIILSSDGTFYTGITIDIEKRFRQHAEGKGARYFRGRKPVAVIYLETGHTQVSALKRELKIKSLSKDAKRKLLDSNLNSLRII